MKLLALCLLVGFAAATSNTLQWQPEKEYRFQYSGRMLSGIPELSTQHSGLGINCTVILKTKTPSEIFMTIENPMYVSINSELPTVDGSATSDWRRLRIPEVQPVPSEHSQIIGMPISFSVTETGDLKVIKVSKEEPAWSVNFKKAMVALFRVKFASSSLQLEDNTVGIEQRNYWTVEEETLFGRCQASYQVNELPEWIVSERPDLIPHPESCHEGKYYEITRTFDMDKCNKMSSFNIFKMSRLFCNSETMNNCGDASVRTSNTRFITCKSTSGNGMTLQSIVNDAAFTAQMTGYKSEYMVSGTFQTLLLKEVRSLSSGNIPQVQQPAVELEDMMYEYGKEWYGKDKEQKLVSSSLLSGRSLANILNGDADMSINEVEREILAVLSEVASEIHSSSSSNGLSTVNKKLLSVARGMNVVDSKKSFFEMYNKLGSGSSNEITETAKQLFLDASIMCGTPQAVSFLKTMVEQRKLSEAEAVHFFTWLPKTVVAPTNELLHELFQLVTSETVKRMNPVVYGAAITGYTSLVQAACVSSKRSATFPTWVFGEFCNPESEIVQGKLIPYLARGIVNSNDEEMRTINIFALGLLKHKNIITELTPVLENQGSSSSSTVDRIVATASLGFGPGSSNPSLVYPVILSVFTNPAEMTEVRIVAFQTLIKMNPPMHVLQAVAATTRQETTMDPELLKFVNMALYTLGHDCSECNLDSLASKARAAFATCKKVSAFVPSSGAWYKTEMLKQMNMGYESVVAWFTSQKTLLPKSAFVHLEQFFGRYSLDTLNAGFWTNTEESFYGNVSGDLEGQIKQGLSAQWTEMIEKLQLDNTRSSESLTKLRSLIFLNVLDSGYLIRSFGERTTSAIKEQVSEMLLKAGGSNSGHINVQKTIETSQAQLMFPTDMGFPLWAEFRNPVTASIVGKMTYNAHKTLPSISLSGKAMIASHFSCAMGTRLPFTREFVITGIEHDSVVNVPGTLSVKLNLEEQKASLSIVPGTTVTEVMHYEVAPYTSIVSFTDLKPMSMSNKAKLIKAKDTKAKVGSFHFGETLGLELVAETKTESSYTGLSSFLDMLSLYNGNPVNMLMFGNTSPALSENGKPSLRHHKYVIRFNPSSSSTKEIAMELKFGYASKTESQTEIQYHRATVMSESERASHGMYIPYGIRSESISSGVHSNRKHMISESMGRLQTSEGTVHGITLLYNVILKGSSRPRTFTYSMTASVGGERKSSGTISQKWDVKMESPVSGKICVSGNVDLPLLPLWNIDELRTSLVSFNFLNKIGFGSRSCEESKIVVTGNAKTSHRQKSLSKESPEARMCMETIRSGVQGSKLSAACETVRRQAATLDEVDFKTEFINVPHFVKVVEGATVVALKGYLWPYYSFGRSSSASGPTSHKTLTRIVFKQTKPTFDLTLDGPFGHIVFSDIHVRSPFNAFFPLKVSSSTAVSAVKEIFGSQVVAPTCVADTKTVTTFVNKTIGFLPGKCFHLLSADCSEYHSFGVTVRNVEGMKKEVHVMLGRTVIEIKPTQSKKCPQVLINNREMDLPSFGKITEINVNSGETHYKATISCTMDGVVVLKAPKLMLDELKTDCEEVLVVPSPLLKNKVCGVCGDIDSSIVSGPKKCVYSRPELAIASYRILSDSCPSMPENIKMELMKENKKCSRSNLVFPTMIASSYKASTGKCTVLRHVISQNGGKVCISKIPITQCGPSCMSRPGDKVEKTVPFTCLPQGRLSEHYIKKAHKGETLDELRSMKTTFATSISQPRHCVHALVSPY